MAQRRALSFSAGLPRRRDALVLLAALPLAGVLAEPAHPGRPLRIIVPVAAGGAAGHVARLLAERLGARLHRPVYIDHRPGGGTIVGTQALARAPNDGDTIGIVIGAHAVNAALRRTLPYDPVADFAPVCLAGHFVVALVAHPDVPADDMAQLLALARRASPPLRYASLGVGSGTHLAGAMLAAMARIELAHVPYNGSAAAYQDLIGRRLELAFVTLDSALPLARAGQIKILGVASGERSRAHPRYPAMAETVPGYEASGFFGFMAPAGTPREVVERLADGLIAVLREPAVARRLEEAGMEIIAERPAAFDAYLRREIERYAELARRSGLRIE